jgi:uncharacterized Zn-binding protein involved in type VI secretion
MTTSTPIAESGRFRVIGVRMPSAAQQQAAQQAMIAGLHNATRNGDLDWTQLHAPSNPVSAVYEDESGARFVGMSTPFGPQMIEIDNSPEFAPMSNTSDGGFLSLDRLSSITSNQGAAQPMMMSTLTTDAAKALMSKPQADGGPSIAESILKSMAMGIGQQAVGSALAGIASGDENGKLIKNFVASTTTTDGLTKLGASLASGLISNVIGMGLSAAMSKWKVDDESSTAEHAAKKAAEALVGKLQSELMSLIDEQIAKALGTAGPPQAPVPPGSSPKSLTEKITEFFTGPTSTASVPVGCIGCGNTNDGIVLTGAPTILVSGLPACRQSDKVTMTKPIPDIGPLLSGNPTVLSLKLPTAGDGHVAVGAKGVVTLLQNCVTTVLMGPQGMPVVTPTPKEPPVSAVSDATAKTGHSDSSRAAAGVKPTDNKSDPRNANIESENRPDREGKSTNPQAESESDPDDRPTSNPDLNNASDGSDANQSSIAGLAKETAPLAEDTYQTNVDDRRPVGKFKVVDRHEGQLGFAAAVYAGEVQGKDSIVIAFRGTESGLTSGALDWLQNLSNVRMTSSQHVQAVQYVNSIKALFPGKNIILTGHSLGGGLASFSGIMTGVPTIAFNSAGPTPHNMLVMHAAGWTGLANIGANKNNIIHVNAKTDPLTNTIAGRPWRNNVYEVEVPAAPNGSSSIIHHHSMTVLNQAIQSGIPLVQSRQSQPSFKTQTPYVPYLDLKTIPAAKIERPYSNSSPSVGDFVVDPATGRVTYG